MFLSNLHFYKWYFSHSRQSKLRSRYLFSHLVTRRHRKKVVSVLECLTIVGKCELTPYKHECNLQHLKTDCTSFFCFKCASFLYHLKWCFFSDSKWRFAFCVYSSKHNEENVQSQIRNTESNSKQYACSSVWVCTSSTHAHS